VLCAAILGSLAAAGLAGPTAATTYNETFTFNAADLTCGRFSGEKLCAESVMFSSPVTAVAGDKYNITVVMSRPFTVPGGSTADLFLVNLLDSTATTLNPGAAGADIAKAKLTMTGYSGPAAPISGGGTTSWDLGYYAVAGFCCGYGTPNGGFTLEGANATITLVSADANPLVGMAVSYLVATVPEPGGWAMMILGLGMTGGLLRRRTRLA
jgi:hypothetical protein